MNHLKQCKSTNICRTNFKQLKSFCIMCVYLPTSVKSIQLKFLITSEMYSFFCIYKQMLNLFSLFTSSLGTENGQKNQQKTPLSHL